MKGADWRDWFEYKMLVDTEVVLLSNNCWVYIRLKVNWVAEFELPIWESMVYNDGIWSYKSIGDIAQGKYSFIFWMFIIFKLFFIYVEYQQGRSCFYVHLGYTNLYNTMSLNLSAVKDIKHLYQKCYMQVLHT